MRSKQRLVFTPLLRELEVLLSKRILTRHLPTFLRCLSNVFCEDAGSVVFHEACSTRADGFDAISFGAPDALWVSPESWVISHPIVLLFRTKEVLLQQGYAISYISSLSVPLSFVPPADVACFGPESSMSLKLSSLLVRRLHGD